MAAILILRILSWLTLLWLPFLSSIPRIPLFLLIKKPCAEARGKDNAQALFGIQQICSDNHIRDMLDPVAPGYLSPVFDKVFETLQKHRLLSPVLWYRDNLLIALDGTRYFGSSQKISCPNCSTTERNETLTYPHSAITLPTSPIHIGFFRVERLDERSYM